MTERYTIMAVADNCPGVLARATAILARRRINIENLTAYETEVPGISRFAIVVNSDEHSMYRVVGQIRKIIEVREVQAFRDDELVFQEVGMGRIRVDSNASAHKLALIVKSHGGTMLPLDDGCWLVEISGEQEEVTRLCEALSPYGLTDFIRSGRIALPISGFQSHLKWQEEVHWDQEPVSREESV